MIGDVLRNDGVGIGVSDEAEGHRARDVEGARPGLDDAIDAYRFFMQLAARRGLALTVYEGGTHFNYSGERDGPDDVQKFLVAMTRDPRMYELYSRNYREFREAGGSTFNVWGWVARDDAWANSDSVTELEHPKYRAIRDFARALRDGTAATRPE